MHIYYEYIESPMFSKANNVWRGAAIGRPVVLNSQQPASQPAVNIKFRFRRHIHRIAASFFRRNSPSQITLLHVYNIDIVNEFTFDYEHAQVSIILWERNEE